MIMRTFHSLIVLVTLSSCVAAPDTGEPTPSEAQQASGPSAAIVMNPEVPGPHVVGTTRFVLPGRDGRSLPVQVWYPAIEAARAEAAAGRPLWELEPEGARRDTLSALFARAPEGCPTRTIHAAVDAEPVARAEPWPLVLYSHCHTGARFGDVSVAERLASWGFVVAAPDHEGNTIYDQVAGRPSQLTPAFLQVRGGDITDVLDALLAGAPSVPEKLRGTLDAERVGMFGHSFGSITTGLILQNEPRVKAGAMIAGPPENPLLTGVQLAKVTKPGLFFHAQDDNAFPPALNDIILRNFEAYPAPARLISVKDAGHWSFSGLAGLLPDFAPGCGRSVRQTGAGESFAYLDNAVGRGIAQAYVTAFFAAELTGHLSAHTYLDGAHPAGTLTVSRRP